MEYFYLARQVILDRYDSIIGYELLYRDAKGVSSELKPRHATASVLVNLLNQAGLQQIVGDKLAFINVDEIFLKRDLIESIPINTCVFELTGIENIDEYAIDRVKRFHEKGYKFSIDLDSYKRVDILKEMQSYLSYVKIDSNSFEVDFLKAFLDEFKRTKIKFIASKIEDRSEFNIYNEAGCDGFQGYYFAKPDIIKDKQLEGNYLAIFRLCDTLQHGSSIEDIMVDFEQNPSITLQLFQFINSGAFHFRSRISSIQQVITLLGRNTLVQWLMLLLYSKNFGSNTKTQNPLIILVKQRTEIMVNLLKLIKKDVTQAELGEAYFVGIFSLMDTLLHIPLSEVIKEFQIEDNIELALFEKEGLLGELYSVALAIEEFDTNLIDNFLDRHDINAEVFEQMMLSVFESATNFEKSMPS